MSKIKKGFLIIFLREWKRFVCRPVYLMGMIIIPLFCFIFFTTLMWEGVPERLPVGIVDNDNTSVSRGLVRTINSMSAVEVSNMEESYVSAKNAMLRNEIYAFIVIPEGFAADANSGKQPEIALFSNDAYYVAGLFTYKALKTAAALANGAVIKKQLIARGMPESLIDARLQPVVLNSNPIGNPWLNYSIYLNNVLLPCMLQLLVLLMTVFAVGIEMKEGTSRRLLVMSNGSVTKLLFAKLLPQTILFTLMGWGLQIYLYAFLRFPLHCNLIIMFTAMFLMIVAAQALGIFLISILPVLRLGLSSAALFGVLGFSIVGFSLPVFSMYKPFQWIAELYPIRHYFMIYANSALDGGAFWYSLWQYLYLVIFLFLPIPLLPRLKSSLYKQIYKP